MATNNYMLLPPPVLQVATWFASGGEMEEVQASLEQLLTGDQAW